MAFWEAVQGKKAGEMVAMLGVLGKQTNIHSSLKPMIPILQAILKGKRDPQLAADPALDFDDAAEILFLLERL